MNYQLHDSQINQIGFDEDTVTFHFSQGLQNRLFGEVYGAVKKIPV